MTTESLELTAAAIVAARYPDEWRETLAALDRGEIEPTLPLLLTAVDGAAPVV